VWLYFRFPLSLRMVEDLPAARGIIVSHRTVRLWAEKFGRTFANEIPSAHPGGSEECEQMPVHAVARSDDTRDAGSHVRSEPDDEAYAPILLGSELAVRIEI
jgi:hypothetical protein